MASFGNVRGLTVALKNSFETVAAVCDRRSSLEIPRSALTERRYSGLFQRLVKEGGLNSPREGRKKTPRADWRGVKLRTASLMKAAVA